VKSKSTKNSAESEGSSNRRNASWDLKFAVRNYSTLVISNFAVAFFSFASVSLIIKYLGTEGNGGVVAIIAASQIIQIFINWTAVALARFGVEEYVGEGEITRSFWTRTLILLPNILLLAVTAQFWFPYLASWLKLPPETFWLIIFHFISLALWLHIQHALQGAKLPRRQGILLAIERAVIFCGLIILLWFGKLTPLTALWAYIFSPILMSVVGLWELRKTLSWQISFDTNWFSRFLKFSVPLIPFAVVGYLSTGYFDAIFISQFLSKADLGMYSVVYQLNGIMMQFPSLAGVLLMPLFVTLQTKNQDRNVNVYLKDVLPLLTLVWSFGCVLVAVFVGIALPLYFGAEFDRAGQYLLVLAAGATFAMPLLVGYSPFTNALSATYISTIAAVAAAVTNVGFNLYLIPRYGLIGCAWATSLAYAASFLVMLTVTHRRFKLKHIWTIQSVLPVLATAIGVSWSGKIPIGLLCGFLTALGLVIFQYKAIIQSVKTSVNFKDIMRGLK